MYSFIWFFTSAKQLPILIVLYKRASTVQSMYWIKWFACCRLARRRHCPVECIYQFYGLKLAIGKITTLQPKDIHILIPGTCEHGTFYAREKLRLQMEVMLLISWPWDEKSILDFPGCLCVITQVLTSGRGRLQKACQSDVRWERLGQCCWVWRRRMVLSIINVGSL